MEALIVGIERVATIPTLTVVSLGSLLGIIVGALPGLTATMGIALMLPVSFRLPGDMGFALLLGVYCGAVAGASIPAILLGIPGNPNAIATSYDGFLMTKNGKAREALGAAALASAIGGLLSLLVLAVISPLIARFTLLFGPAERAALAAVGLTIIASVSAKNIGKGVLMGALGLALAFVGTDPFTDAPRLPFPQYFADTPFISGFKLIPVLIGLYGVAQVLLGLDTIGQRLYVPPQVTSERFLPWPKPRKLLSMWRILLESSGIGTIIGAIPGTGASIAVFMAYERAQKITSSVANRLRKKDKLDPVGSGSIEGVMAPEVANNAVTGGALIPVLTLGLPGDPVTAVLLGALLVQGVVPGYRLFTEDLHTVYAILFSLFIANLAMVVFLTLGVKVFPKILALSKAILFPIVLILAMIGAYAVEGAAVASALFDMGVALTFGIVGYYLSKADFPRTPIVLGLVLGRLFEVNFRRAIHLAEGNFFVFLTKPIAIGFIVLALASVTAGFLRRNKS